VHVRVVLTVMGRGLSELQATILVLAYRNHQARMERMATLEEGSYEYLVLTEGVPSVDLYYPELLREHFGFEVRSHWWSPELGGRPTGGAKFPDAKDRRAPVPFRPILAIPRRRAARGSRIGRTAQRPHSWT
jgi:hypothetical protein